MADENELVRRNVLMTDALWEGLGEAVKRSPDPRIKDRATLFREFAWWYTRQPGARMPARPPALKDGEDG